MPTRRTFLRQALGGTAAAALSTALPSSRVLGANDRVRLGLIGGGGRGKEIFKVALRCPNTEAAAVADIYTRRFDEVKQFAPNIKTYTDFRQLLDDKSVDAVLIATPQHLHALHFVPAIQAGKDVYQEKTMAFNPDHAKRMRKALEGTDRVVQVGIQSTSSQAQVQAREMVSNAQQMGTITAIHSHMYRNAPYGGWRTPIPPDCDLQNVVDWNAFQGEAAPHDFTPERFIHWRFYWSYSGGNVFENMVHQVGFWYKALDLKIPKSVAMKGGNFLSPDMEVPDTMDVSMEQPENLLFTWNSGFGNRHFSIDEEVLGTRGTVVRNDQDVRYLAELPRHRRSQAATPAEESKSSAAAAPDIVGVTDETKLHMQNFLDCVRSRKQPNCPLEIGFRAAVACRMAVEAYRQSRVINWDAEKEDIV
jgi:predicted dehydrogenase